MNPGALYVLCKLSTTDLHPKLKKNVLGAWGDSSMDKSTCYTHVRTRILISSTYIRKSCGPSGPELGRQRQGIPGASCQLH